MARNEKNKTFEDITIAFRNFAGKEDVYNREGDRNFVILLDPERERQLLAEGWNVKYLKERDDGDTPQAYIQVAVSYRTKPPKIAMVTSRSFTYLDENMVEMLDHVDIETADVTLNPYEWAVNGKSGVKAYVKTLIVKIEEDYLEMKWRQIVEDGKKDRLEIESGEKDYIDGEYELT